MRPLRAAIALGALALRPAAEGLEAALAGDDHCVGGEACALSAVQLRRKQSAGDAHAAGDEWSRPFTCAHFHACGRYVKWQPCQCNWRCHQYHNCCSDYQATCVRHEPPPPPPAPPPPPPPPAPAPPAPAPVAGPTPAATWDPSQKVLLQPSTGELLTFYMYRAQSNTSYPLENVNTANLAGALWYIQNEIVSGKWGSYDRFGISMIMRWKVQTRATQTLADKKMNFGLRVSFDSGECTNKACAYDWWLYGYNVGCNNLGQYPFPMFETYYPGGVWYSLPGPCPASKYHSHNATCEGTMPGGHCAGVPTGRGDCTYNYEDAGYITLDELYASQGLTKQAFWASPNSYEANGKKVQAAGELFAKKYPGMPTPWELKDPPCDFNKKEFFTCEQCRR